MDGLSMSDVIEWMERHHWLVLFRDDHHLQAVAPIGLRHNLEFFGLRDGLSSWEPVLKAVAG